MKKSLKGVVLGVFAAALSFCLMGQTAFAAQTKDAWQTNYLKDLQLQISVPASQAVTVFEERGEDDPNFRADLYPNRYEIYTQMMDPAVFEGVTNLMDATDQQKQAFYDAKHEIIYNEGVKITKEPVGETKEINGIYYVVFTFESNGWGNDYQQKYYATVLNGIDVHFDSFSANLSSEEAKETFYGSVDEMMNTVYFGSEEEIARVATVSQTAGEEEKQSLGDKLMTGIDKLPLWIFYMTVFVLLIIGVKPAKRRSFQEDFLSLDISKGLLGICAVLIVLHHISQQLEQAAGPLMFLENIGVCFVGMFFFFSGYGLLKSFKNKENYLKGFFRKRFPAILIPFYVVIVVFLLASVCMKQTFSPVEWIAYLSGWFLINSHMWYIVEIAIFYLVFFIIFKLCPKINVAVLLMTVFTALFTVGSLMLGHGGYWLQGEWWFNTSLVFAIGMIIANHEERVVSFARKFYWPLLGVTMAALIGLYYATMYMLNHYSYYSEYEAAPGNLCYGDKFRCLSCQLPMVIAFVFFVLLLTMKLQFKNKGLTFLGKISLELYLIHNLFIQLFRSQQVIMIKSSFLYIVAVLTASILSALLLHLLCKWLIRLTQKRA